MRLRVHDAMDVQLADTDSRFASHENWYPPREREFLRPFREYFLREKSQNRQLSEAYPQVKRAFWLGFLP